MSSSRCVIISSWSWRSVLYSSSMYSWHLFILCVSVRSIPFLSFIVPIFACHIPLVSLIFLRRALVFSILLLSSVLCIDHLGKLSYLSLLFLELCIHMDISFLFSFALASILFSAICKASLDNHFSFLHFFSLWMVLTTTSCTMWWTSIHSSSGTLSDLILWNYLSLPLYNCKEFDLGHTWMV